MPRFSLIVATKGRTTELLRFLDSLQEQEFEDFECIIIDQNEDDRLLPIITSRQKDAKLQHVKAPRGLSRSRNRGLAIARGEIVAYPDDDCWYSPQLLKSVSAWFQAHEDLAILGVSVRNEHGNVARIMEGIEVRELDRDSVFRLCVSFSLFVRRTRRTERVRFDETLGVGAGTAFGSGEEIDYVLNLIAEGVNGRYEGKWHVCHPDRSLSGGDVNMKRAVDYGRGVGRVLRKHDLPLRSLAVWIFVRPIGGAVESILRGRRRRTGLYLATAWGRLRGYAASVPSL